jgi:HAD superfamily hydrolase (TIGR01509 family)
MFNFQLALFDLDGTIIDTESQYSQFWGMIGRKYHPEIPDFADVIKGSTLTKIYENYFPDEQIQKEVTILLDEWESKMDYSFIPGALSFVKEVRVHGVKTAIVTSSNNKKLAQLRSKIPYFDDLFDKILTSEMFTASKPDPQCFNLGVELFGIPKKNAAVFEDSLSGLEAGMRSGIFTIGFATTNSLSDIHDKCDQAYTDFTSLSFEDVESFLSSKNK